MVKKLAGIFISTAIIAAVSIICTHIDEQEKALADITDKYNRVYNIIYEEKKEQSDTLFRRLLVNSNIASQLYELKIQTHKHLKIKLDRRCFKS